MLMFLKTKQYSMKVINKIGGRKKMGRRESIKKELKERELSEQLVKELKRNKLSRRLIGEIGRERNIRKKLGLL
jgi:hypothetical protein